MRAFIGLLRRFQKDEGGAFIAIFAVIGIVLIAAAGAVVDYTSMEQARTRAQVALDAAALALQSQIYTQTDTWLKTKAQAVLSERIADPRITATVLTVTKSTANGEIFMTASVQVPMSFVALIGINSMTANIKSKAVRGSRNIEVAVALDITYSMLGTKISSLITATNDLIDSVVQTSQTPTYTRMALVPYSNAVNVGTNAVRARGAYQDYTSITGAKWINPGQTYTRTISAITKANPAVITTSAAHGFTTGDIVQISNFATTGSPATLGTLINLKTFQITVTSTTKFSLKQWNGSAWVAVSTTGATGTYTANSGIVVSGATTRAIQAVSKTNPAQITTTYPHGLSTGDAIYLTSLAGGNFTNLNNKEFQVTVINTTTFSIKQDGSNFSTTGSTYSGSTYTANSGVFRECLTNECEVVLTAPSNGLSENETTYITSIGGMTGFNNSLQTATDVSSGAFTIEDSNGWNESTYTSGGRSYCVREGCYYYLFQNDAGSWNMWTISNCVTERVGANQYNDEAPSTTYVGRNYPNPATSGGWGWINLGTCPALEMQPLTDSKTTLHNLANNLAVEGSTAGQVGLAWAWYAVAPNFSSVFPSAYAAADYTTPNLTKIVVLMTDGAFNTASCNSVVSQNYTVSGASERIDCDATNGDPFVQAATLCTNMKAKGIIVYTVAFDLGSDQDAIDLMHDCANDGDHAFTAANGVQLQEAFQAIGNSIKSLRIAS